MEKKLSSKKFSLTKKNLMKEKNLDMLKIKSFIVKRKVIFLRYRSEVPLRWDAIKSLIVDPIKRSAGKIGREEFKAKRRK